MAQKERLCQEAGRLCSAFFSDHNKARAAKHVLSKNSEWQLFLTDMIIDAGCIIDV
jgi:hypothetical protein